LPDDATMIATADHGMVDIDHDRRLGLVDAPALKTGLRHAGGEPRALHLYVEPGAEAEGGSARRETIGARAPLLPNAVALARASAEAGHSPLRKRVYRPR